MKKRMHTKVGGKGVVVGKKHRDYVQEADDDDDDDDINNSLPGRLMNMKWSYEIN